jgi:iron complex outermembrane receptor protein
LFGTAGLRVERDSRLDAWRNVALLPMLGGTAVASSGDVTLKFRAAYGKGIRPPSTISRVAGGATPAAMQTAQAAMRAGLGPEEQAGVETGVDLSLKDAIALHVTRFDQRASGLIQDVAIASGLRFRDNPMTFAAENVGEIGNRGWELAASANMARLTTSGSLSFVDSHVLRLAPDYTGDLHTGDRMLQVPARTVSINATWTESRWRMSLGGSRAFDWINYDEIALAEAIAGSTQRGGRIPVGDELRTFWRRYDGGFRLRAAGSRDIGSDLALEFSAENLLNYQRGEPDNITVVPGRTIMTGLRVRF